MQARGRYWHHAAASVASADGAENEPAVGREAAYGLGVIGWVAKLPDEARREFAAALSSALEVGDTEPIARLLARWQATADVYADPELSARLRRQKDGPAVPIHRPLPR